jgi:3-deoxy-D-manno-octulosonic-acid transferase
VWRSLLRSFTHFFVQNEDSKLLLHSLGFTENVSVSGDTRYDRVIEIAEKKSTVDFIDNFTRENHVLVAGSTWKKDILLLGKYAKQNPQIKFIVAPHEINKHSLDEAKNIFTDVIFYSELTIGVKLNQQPNVLIIDNIGMLSRLYRYADIAYIGGGFNKSGIHNTLEAAAYGKPVIFGPYYKKFAEAVTLINKGGGYSIINYNQLESMLDNLFSDQTALRKAGNTALEIVKSNKGATEKICSYVKENRLLTN